MRETVKKLNNKVFFFWLIQPLSLALFASLTHSACCQALDSKNSRLSLEMISDISKLPNENARAFITNTSETAVDATRWHLIAIQNLTYENGEQKMSRRADKIIPLEKFKDSEGLIIDENGKMISFTLMTHKEMPSARMVAYSLVCYIVNEQFNPISDTEVIEWSLLESSSEKHLTTLFSQLQQYFIYASMNTFLDKLVYPLCRDYIFEPITKSFFKSSNSNKPSGNSEQGK